MGVQVRYGDNSIGGNAKKNINRTKAAEKNKQRRQKEKEKEQECERVKEREEQSEQERLRQQKNDERMVLLTSTVMQLSQTVQRLSDMKK